MRNGWHWPPSRLVQGQALEVDPADQASGIRRHGVDELEEPLPHLPIHGLDRRGREVSSRFTGPDSSPLGRAVAR